jgi:hypothetical protein
MPKQEQSQNQSPEDVAGQFSDEEMEQLKRYGQALGGGPSAFDEEVEKHLAGHEAHYAKMRAAQTGGASADEMALAPPEIPQAQMQGQQISHQRQTAQSAQQAQAAQAQQQQPTPPPAPIGPAGVSEPYEAQSGHQSESGNQEQEEDGAGGMPPQAPPQ